MVKKPWRPTKGEAGLYMVRAKALRKLGVSLADFRRLCILKGVFPRIPKKKLQGRDKVYYHVKDIQHLACEPLLNKFREQKVITKKIAKAVAKHDVSKAQLIEGRQTQADISHIIRERYPTLLHALRDLDDAVSCIALFATLPVAPTGNITGGVISECRQLIDQWLFLTSELKCVNKVFASLKGYYYEATILGQNIVWLAPHEFSTSPAKDVDLRVMATFLELYRALMKFTMFKLYQLAGLRFPPSPIQMSVGAEGRFLNLRADSVPAASLPADAPALVSNDPAAQARRKLFSKQTFYVSRETPVFQLVYVLRACGAKVTGFDETIPEIAKPLSPITATEESITHQIVDRPTEAFEKMCERQLTAELRNSRTFVQPQWVFDCINNNALLPAEFYGPGVVPPSHLSPFVDDEAEGHIPEQRKVIAGWTGGVTAADQIVGQELNLASADLEHEDVVAIVDASKAAAEEPSADVAAKLAKLKADREAKQKQTDKERGKAALSRKKRDMYTRVEAREKAEASALHTLKTKAKKSTK